MPITSKHVLISRQDNIGDIILTLPMAARLKQLNPGVKITLLCRAYAAEVVRYCDDIDDVVDIESIKDDLFSYLKQSDIDTVILAQPDHPLVKAAFRARIPHRIANARQKIYQLLYCNRRVYFSKGQTDNHEAQINFEFLRPYGLTEIPDRSDTGLISFQCSARRRQQRTSGTARFQPDSAYKIQRSRQRMANHLISGSGARAPPAN